MKFNIDNVKLMDKNEKEHDGARKWYQCLKTHIHVPNALAMLTENFMQIKNISQLFKPCIS